MVLVDAGSVVVLVVTIAGLVGEATAASAIFLDDTQPRNNQPLSFSESIYVKLSSACRAIVDFRYSTLRDNGSEVLKSLVVIHLHGDTVKTTPINETFLALTENTAEFDISKQTKIIIHGFRDSAKSEVPFGLAKAYNDKKMFNVLMIDAEGALGNSYMESVHNAPLIGRRIANLLANLEHFGANAEDFHLLGISLGAHIAGWAGKYFRKYKGRKLGRITGLDPAGPCFTYAQSDQRLDRQDADYVDVIHSNKMIQGVIEPLGHSDYYLNGGGPMQPGCFMPNCSHLRAALVYAESIKIPKSFVGVRCESWKKFTKKLCDDDYSVLGYGSSSTSRGLYYLRTNSDSPYGLGMNGAHLQNTIPKYNEYYL